MSYTSRAELGASARRHLQRFSMIRVQEKCVSTEHASFRKRKIETFSFNTISRLSLLFQGRKSNQLQEMGWLGIFVVSKHGS